MVAKKDNSGARTYFHNDHLGSTTVVTNQAGTLVEQTKYDPWGEVNVGGTVSKFQYTGQERDTETGLNYYNFRYYDPHIRRFTQPDDVIQNVYDPQNLNRYSYVRNNPLKYTDPTGNISILEYNKMLSNPTAQNYNNTMSQFAAIPGNTAVKGFATQSTHNKGDNKNNSTAAGGSVTDINILTLQDNMREAAQHKISILNHPLVNAINTYWFVRKVWPGGEWDYKKGDPNNPLYEAFGNINFGATGREQGWNIYFLDQGAGGVQKTQQTGDKLIHFFKPEQGVRKSEGTIFVEPPYWDEKLDYDNSHTGYYGVGKWY